MTQVVQLQGLRHASARPTFASTAGETHLQDVHKAIFKAKRIVVVCGAGVSVGAGIPDFRGFDGMFNTLKRENKELVSGKDLFDASVFNSEHTTSLFYRMIARLSTLSTEASPTPFHELLKLLDERGQLLRVYTQNIDTLEEKAGLSFGLPELASTPVPTPAPIVPSPTPRCIPLHGTLQSLVCHHCTYAVPVSQYLPFLAKGDHVACPQCEATNAARRLVGKRERPLGRMRPSVVLYGETHNDGEDVGECVRRDLIGGGGRGKAKDRPDLVIVAGTSLRIPGTKRIVREFAKAVQTIGNPTSTKRKCSDSESLPTPAPTPTTGLPKTIYLNLDFPMPARDWDGVFDSWVQGDVQSWA
ncbi:hypothetical protein BOTBODRAFT_111494, partial [Botryobasidium botryosum FD-172 SS1]